MKSAGGKVVEGLDNDWQATKSNMRERNAMMLDNDLMADVCFIVGSGSDKRRIPAHKYMLATGSSVFYTMFYGGLPENKDITIPDVEPEAFLNLLRWDMNWSNLHVRAVLSIVTYLMMSH